jgi:mTERF domain-containing protein
MSSLRPLALPHIKSPNFCTQTETPSTIPPGRGAVIDFFINKCGLTNNDITKVFRHRNRLFNSTQKFEEVLELLNGCGLTTPAQIRKVVLCNPRLFFSSAEGIIQSKLAFLRTIMKEEDISKLVYTNSNIFTMSEGRIKFAISLLQRLGIEGQELSKSLATQPRLLTISEEKLIESFKQAENIGFKKGSKMFAIALRSILGVGKENLDRRLRCLSDLGFSEKQVSELVRRQPSILALSEEKLKLKVDFLVKSVELPLAELFKYPCLLALSLETRMIPRFRVMEALKSMQEQVLKRESSFSCIAMLTEKCFLDKYVNSNAESLVLRDIYHTAKLET